MLKHVNNKNNLNENNDDNDNNITISVSILSLDLFSTISSFHISRAISIDRYNKFSVWDFLNVNYYLYVPDTECLKVNLFLSQLLFFEIYQRLIFKQVAVK